MRRKPVIILIFLLSACTVSAQTETDAQGDSIDLSTINIKPFGEFMLDMSLFTPFQSPKIDFNNIFGTNIQGYNLNFKLDSNITYGVNIGRDVFSYPGFYGGFFNSHGQVQVGSFQFNDNIRLNTYGHYNSDGWRVRNPGEHPRRKNDFMGGMELKFNKNFGIRVELIRSHNSLYPYY